MIKESDRYFTPQWVIDTVLEQFGGIIDLDPAHDPDPACLVKATQVFDIRNGEDGLVLPWTGSKVFLNPPYSSVLPWVIRAAQHAAAGGEVVMLVNASTDTAAWQQYVLVHGVPLLAVGRHRRSAYRAWLLQQPLAGRPHLALAGGSLLLRF